MKPSPFEYLAARDIDEALGALGEHDGEAKVLAGGQSFVPAMNFRLATPSLLVDLNRIEGLASVHVDGDELVVQCLARHRDLEVPASDDATAVLLARMSHLVGHLPIRVRGTASASDRLPEVTGSASDRLWIPTKRERADRSQPVHHE